MGKRSKARSNRKLDDGYVLFDVVYEDGSRRSNRKVPRSELSGLDGDVPAKAIIEAQDRAIGELSGRAPLNIKSISRSATR